MILDTVRLHAVFEYLWVATSPCVILKGQGEVATHKYSHHTILNPPFTNLLIIHTCKESKIELFFHTCSLVSLL